MQLIMRSRPIPARGCTAPGEIVLRKSESGSCHPFVVHFHNLQTGGYCFGDYHSDQREAEAAFRERCRRYQTERLV